MNYEKKYREALEIAKHYHDRDNIHFLEHIFPELKESEDERIRTLLISSVKNETPIASEHNKELAIAWLEKQGEQKQEENKGNIGGISPNWSEEDEKLYTSALWHIKNSCGNGGKDSGEYEVYNWFKSLKDRVQPKQEWSEEDEKMLISALCHVSNSASNGKSTDYQCEVTDWLKSLKPQNRWKASKEQMDALNAINLYGEISYVGQRGLLIKLYQDLKKFKLY